MGRADHRSVGDVERGEQAGRAVPQVVVRAPLAHPGHHRERRLRARQRLHLAFLIHAQHDRRFRRVQVQTDDVVDLLHEQRVGGELERVGAVRRQPERPPDPTDRRLRQPRALGHLRPRPMRRVLRRGLKRRDQHLLDLLGGDRRRPAPAADHPRAHPTAARRTAGATCPPSPATRHTPPPPSLFARPSAHFKTIRERNANACEDLRLRSHLTSCSRSESLNSNACLGRPVRAMPQHTTLKPRT